MHLEDTVSEDRTERRQAKGRFSNDRYPKIWTTMRAWLATGAIPDEDDLEADLTGPEYGYGADQVSIQLEKKRDMKARGLPSPDDADALALTFAEPVLPVEGASIYNPVEIAIEQPYDRYGEIDEPCRVGGW